VRFPLSPKERAEVRGRKTSALSSGKNFTSIWIAFVFIRAVMVTAVADVVDSIG